MSEEQRAALTPQEARAYFREGVWQRSTRGFADGYLQCGVVFLRSTDAADFLAFCCKNNSALPFLDALPAGSATPGRFAPDADLRTDVPLYHIYKDGELADEVTDLSRYWRGDMVSFLLGCSITFDAALKANGIPNRQLSETGEPTMFVTGIECVPAGRFEGPLVVSMRPMLPSQTIRAIQVTSRFPHTHGAPIHFGNPAAIGIADISQPDVGRPVRILEDEVPVFWPCIGTIWSVVSRTKPELIITHAPGCMFIADKIGESMSIL
ncbi:D-glutamate cyclase family protein [Pelagibius sp.]|uniref:D-glutamate cyclase family protein n=1 Tax=Pelagibius sp. TaxID=1931238 RepID=UPI003BB13BCB